MGGSGGKNQMIETICLYKILSLGFSYPDEKNWEIMEKQFSISKDLFKGDLLLKLTAFEKCFKENRQNLNDARCNYMSIFDTGRKISPYETEYMDEKISRKPFELADISGFYRAFGFNVAQDAVNKESVDHISIELEFMAILTWKHEYARNKNQDENIKIVHEARQMFLKDHLANWGFFFCDQINHLTGFKFYKTLARLYKLVLTLECDRYLIDLSSMKKQMVRVPYNGVRSEQLTCN
jgi:TorA maturation chaperone TorD